uniref:Glycylpeptide N-tetradecanoyltransferase n=1 Tax=Albugo laibachii Nc14 TaxID=890382 RepID=F0WF43_9STRA|nr:glycylpeptide Ntetradecanoyltransferase 2 putative [Albugo laibachii Nc14]|eukprot:CCA19825.1 glycylpeptide Ntetradecanoyltransferase 2 putative [Albugo laibachii Nc14]
MSESDKIEAKKESEQEEFLRIIQQLSNATISDKTKKIKTHEDHVFWNTQPVPKLDEFPGEHEAVNPNRDIAQVRAQAYAMPQGFHWVVIDLKDDTQAQEVYQLLTENYVEDDGNTFRFDYSIDFLKWALLVPDYNPEWHIGVRNEKTNKLMAFISGIPARVRVYQHFMEVAEINFLCVHKKLRTKRLAPVLIKEVTRRVNLKNVWQAVYTAGVVLPMPVSQCRYFHRSLNPKKLVEVGFSRLPNHMTMSGLIKGYKLPSAPLTRGLRAMEKKDVPQVSKMLQKYLEQFHLTPMMEEKEVEHLLLPRNGVVSAYVVEDSESAKITDFCSFYHLPSSIIGHEKYKKLNAAYSFYNVATSVTLTDLMQDALILAKQENFDVFNALSLMNNAEIFKKLRFCAGDGDLRYYLFNWRCPRMESDKVGLVLC